MAAISNKLLDPFGGQCHNAFRLVCPDCQDTGGWYEAVEPGIGFTAHCQCAQLHEERWIVRHVPKRHAECELLPPLALLES